MTTTTTTQQSVVPFIGRILIGIVFLLSGLSKLAAAQATQGFIASVGLPLPVLGYIVAVTVEVGGGLMLLLGYRTRTAALVLSVFTVATAVFFHHDFADQNQFIHFMKNIAMTGGLLQVVAFGAGAYSLDRRRVALPARSLQSRPSA
jgi:putative oxidoreductase